MPRTLTAAKRSLSALRELSPALLAITGLILVLAVAETIGSGRESAAAAVPRSSASPPCPTASPAYEGPVDGVELKRARDAAPAAAIAPSERTFDRRAWTPVEPSLTEAGGSNELAVTGSLGAGAISTARAGGFELAGVLCMVPMQTTAAETPGGVVNGDSVLHANSAPDTDTIIRPTAGGMAVVASLRGPQAPTSLSWRLALPTGYGLRALAGGAVAIEDPSSATPATGPTPQEPVDVDRLAALPDAAAQLAESRYEIARAERETGHQVAGVLGTPYGVDSQGDSVPAPLTISDTHTVTVTVPADARAVALTVAANPRKPHRPKPPRPANAYPLIAIPENLATEAANAACSFAQSQPRGKRLMLLNFGRAHVEAGEFGAGRRPFYSNAEILEALTAAASAYRQEGCHRKGRSAIVAYGNGNFELSSTGNDDEPMSPQLAEEVGAAQLQTALTLQTSLSPPEEVAVAGDLEPGWDPSPTGAKVGKALVRGAASGDLPYYNFGTAGHCPPYAGPDPGCGSWSFRDLGDISQKRMAVPLPEIYHDYQVEQWASVRERWDRRHGRARKCSRERRPRCYSFAGVTSQPVACGADFLPSQSWRQLWKANPPGAVGRELVYYNPDGFRC
jgi:hypothetical protein